MIPGANTKKRHRLGNCKVWPLECPLSQPPDLEGLRCPVKTRLAASQKSEQAPSLLAQQVGERLNHDLATDFGNRRGQGNTLRANLDTVLSVATFLDAAVAHECRQPLVLQSLASGMRVEQPHLRDGGRADESCVLVELRTSFHAAATRDTVR